MLKIRMAPQLLGPQKIVTILRRGTTGDYVLGELLGLSENERRRLVEEKVVY